MRITVETGAGAPDDAMPRRFHMDGRVVEVEEVLDQWLGDDHRYIKLRGDDGNLYILRRDEPAGAWQLTLFKTPLGETLPIPRAPKKSARLFTDDYLATRALGRVAKSDDVRFNDWPC